MGSWGGQVSLGLPTHSSVGCLAGKWPRESAAGVGLWHHPSDEKWKLFQSWEQMLPGPETRTPGWQPGLGVGPGLGFAQDSRCCHAACGQDPVKRSNRLERLETGVWAACASGVWCGEGNNGPEQGPESDRGFLAFPSARSLRRRWKAPSPSTWTAHSAIRAGAGTSSPSVSFPGARATLVPCALLSRL